MDQLHTANKVCGWCCAISLNTVDTESSVSSINSNGHSIEDFSFMPIDYVSNNMNRLLKETYWIHKLDTLYPKGLNAKVLYKI